MSNVGCGVIVTPKGPVWTGAGFCAGVTNGFIVGWDLAVLCTANISYYIAHMNIITYEELIYASIIVNLGVLK